MSTDDTDNTKSNYGKRDLIHGELSYKINGILFATHNELGQYAREKQYADVANRLFKENALGYEKKLELATQATFWTELSKKKY